LETSHETGEMAVVRVEIDEFAVDLARGWAGLVVPHI